MNVMAVKTSQEHQLKSNKQMKCKKINTVFIHVDLFNMDINQKLN